MSINRNALKNYAPKARQDFIAAVTARAAKFGISDSEPVPMQEQGDVVIIGGEAFPKNIGVQRKALVRRINLHGFNQTVEEVAYTWFNRFLAIRFMELHGYLDHGHRVLSHPDGGDLPEILEHAEHLDLAGLDKARVVDLKLDGTKDAELYRRLLIAQCNALHNAMPFLFEKIDDETELLLPDNLLHSDSLIRQLVGDIDEADWQEIEIIGWLYQFYISEKKDQVIGKVVKSEDIPAATQLFTPNWIVKYMVQNSLGHQWMATYPSSSLKNGMDYYIEPAEQTPEVQAQLAETTPKELNPEELTLLDPAAGSGHILVEAYDLFKQIYLERGYRLKDIPRLILENNLYGLDIDDRAAQMAGFALLMKARADDRRILSNPVLLNVMAIQSSEGLDAADITKHLLPSGRHELVASDDLLPDTLAQPTLAANSTSEVKAGTIESLINLFEDAKTFGSLITVPDNIQKALPALEQLLDQPSSGDLLQTQMREHAVDAVRPLAEQANMLGRQYDCVVANPPYMGIKKMNNKLKGFVRSKHSMTQTDLFSVFIEKCLGWLCERGFCSLVTMQSWMFLSSFEKMRENLFQNYSFNNFIHLGSAAFSEISGDVVQTCSFSVLNKKMESFRPVFVDATKGGESKKECLIRENKGRYANMRQIDFFEIPGTPIAYWSTPQVRNSFSKNKLIKDIAMSESLNLTGNNDKFLRLFWEIDRNQVGIGKKWLFYTKGGQTRKWYGNLDYVVNWSPEAISFYRADKTARIIPEHLWYEKGVTWTKITSGTPSFRDLPADATYDVGGSSIIISDDTLRRFTLSFLNSCVSATIMKIINPTVNMQVGNVLNLPVIDKPLIQQKTDDNCDSLLKISKADWDSLETSWDFETFPLLSSDLMEPTTEESFSAWENQCFSNIQTMKELEEENNRLFIEAYGLQDELTPEVPEDQITLARADRDEDIKRLISYAIGCMMGRYSLAEEGLIYANSGNEGFEPSRYGDFPADDDGIIPITDTEWFDDDATVRFEDFLKVAWSPETLKENLKFIGDSLANNGGNDPLKTIRNYLSKGFYKDHLKTYKKRPIYWLFSSGKQRAFECLVYLHRFNEGTLARMRMEYITPLQSRMSARIEQLTGDVDSASSSAERNRKQKEKDKLVKQLEELRAFDEEHRHYADQRITLDLDDGVKVNYGKFGNLLADVKAITGKK